MIEKMRRNARSALLIGAAAALVGGGMALAAGNGSEGSGSGSGSGSGTAAVPRDAPPLPPPGGAPGGGDLTFAEFHVLKNGSETVFRTDAGTVKSADDSSLTITENDGTDVTIPVDSGTKVLAGPDKEVSVSQLDRGSDVNVSRQDGEAADVIFVVPSRSEMKAMAPGDSDHDGRFGPRPGGPPPGFAMPAPPAQGN